MVNELSIDYALKFMHDMVPQWSAPPLELRQKIQNLIFPNVFVCDKNEKFINNKISPLYRDVSTMKQADGMKNSDVVTLPGIEPGLLG